MSITSQKTSRRAPMRQCLLLPVAAVVAILTGLASTTLPASASSSERCYADWSEAAEIVKAQALVTAKDVHERARLGQIGDVVRMTLCEDKGRYVYRLVVREAKGQVIKLTVDAKAPF